MNTHIGRYKLVDTYFPSKSPDTEYVTLFAASSAAIMRNIATGQPHRFIVRGRNDDSVTCVFRMVGAL